MNTILGAIHIRPSKKSTVKILKDVSGMLKPNRMTLLLGPPRAGKSTLLQALSGRQDYSFKQTGKVTFNGHELSEFVPQKSCAYISKYDVHHAELTVRETLNFSNRCLGVGAWSEMLEELSRREKEAGIMPDPDIDAFMKATSMSCQRTNLFTDYVLKLLGLDICADTMVGSEDTKGISGGQKKRVTTGEMVVGPAKVLLMDEISTGLDSSTTYQICKYMKQMVHTLDLTTIISLLQPHPETYELFDDIILMSEGRIVYQGHREDVLEFFENLGFKCPERKAVADFLQEVTSEKDQEQYWCGDRPYAYVSVSEFCQAFNSFHVGQKLESDLCTPYDKSKSHPAALVKRKYGISSWALFRACFSREWMLMKRNYFLYVFNSCQILIMALVTMTVFLRTTMPHKTIADGGKYFGALFVILRQAMFIGSAPVIFSLPIFYRQRDFFFYPAWAYALPMWILRIPLSFFESGLWIILTYYSIGFAPEVSRFFCQWLALFCTHQMAVSLFHFIAAVGRNMTVTNSIGMFTILVTFLLGGYVVGKEDVGEWMKWAFYLSPMMYGQNSIVINEFLDKRWSMPNTDQTSHGPTIGKALLASRDFYTEQYWYWIGIGALLGFSVLFNILFIMALTWLNPLSDSKTVVLDDNDGDNETQISNGRDNSAQNTSTDSASVGKGMVLPFLPFSLTFNHINYYVDMPTQMKSQGFKGDRLQLLKDISGSFRPKILTALVGESGSGKTTLMDVLTGRKTVGYIEGDINISGYPKTQKTFARISGYCEQKDTHSPHVTVYESLAYSALLRLSHDVDTNTRKMFVEQVMDLVELKPIRDAMVGLPGVDGLSTEQRKRLTIAVELVANPSIIFMDEPTSGLDARAAAIVMRTVRNTVETGRTVVCTIHQPSIDIFEAFDELLLLKRGGRVMYAGPLGQNSRELIDYFQAIPGVPKIMDGYNPAAWVLDISTSQEESRLNIDFAEHYANSPLYQKNQELITKASKPPPGSEDLSFPTKYNRGYLVQYKACLWKQYWSYWRNPKYNVARFMLTFAMGLIFGLVFWNKGGTMKKEQDLSALLGCMYSAVYFLGSSNGMTVQPVAAIERTVYYREKAAGMYSALPYAFAQVTIEVLYNGAQSLIYSLILYSTLGFQWTAVKFFYFYYIILMCFLYFTYFGMMLVSLTPSPQYSAIASNLFFGMWNLFSGFIIARPRIPIWWRWYYWACPVAWTLYGIVGSQVGDSNTPLEVPGSSEGTTVKLYLKNDLGYEYDFLPVVAAVHVGWVLLFIIGFVGGIKFMNFQKR